MKNEPTRQLDAPSIDICPITGQEIHHYPEWTTETGCGAYSLTVSIIANQIVHVRSAGCLSSETLLWGLELIDRVRLLHIPADRPFAIIEDMSRMETIPIALRKLYVDYIKKLPHVGVLVLCHVSGLQKFVVRLGGLVQFLPFPVLVAKDHAHAVELALDVLCENKPNPAFGLSHTSQNLLKPESRLSWDNPEFLTNTDWTLKTETFSSTFQVINGIILFSCSIGFLDESDIAAIENLRNRVHRETVQDNAFRYFIMDVTNVEASTWTARKRYIQSVTKWHEQYPLIAVMVYGPNRFMRITTSLAAKILPFRVIMVRDLPNALKEIETLERRHTNAGFKDLTKKSDFNRSTQTDVRPYVDEILNHLAGFSWDGQYPVFEEPPPSNHPFQSVFEAIHLLNLEFRDLLSERSKVEEALKDSEVRYRLIAEHTSDLITLVTFDQNPRYTYVSPSHRHYGYDPDKLVGRAALDFVHPGDRDRLIDELLHLLNQAQTRDAGDFRFMRTIEYRYKSDAGNWYHFEATANAIDNRLILIVARDITERKRVQQILAESHEKLKATIDALPDLMLEVDSNGMIVDYRLPEPKWADMFPLLYPGQSIDSVFSEEAAQIMTAGMNQAEMTGQRQGGIFLTKTPNVEFQIEFSVASKNAAALRDIRFILLCRDITIRWQTETALRQSEEKYRQLIDTAQDMILIMDLTGRPVLMNAAALHASGYSLEEAMSRNVADILAPDDQPLLAEALAIRKTGERGRNRYEIDILTRTGSRIPVEINSALLMDNGQPSGVLVIARDITQRRQAEQEKHRMEDRLQLAQKLESIGLLAGGVAHDFNNILMGIMGHASLLKLSKDMPASRMSHIDDIETLVNRASGLTRQLLGFARSGKYEVKPTRVVDMMRTTADMFGRTHKEIRLRHHHPQDIWMVAVDQGQMDQVLMNLFVNAAQAMPYGGDLTLKTGNVVLDAVRADKLAIPAGHYVQLSVRDTGVGMDAAILPKIFDPFFTTREVGKGSGLGLASAYGIIKNHDGTIEVESTPGVGTCFTIYLPASADQPLPKTVLPISPEISGSGTILLIDDEELIRDVVGSILHHLGYAAITASSGREAIHIYEQRTKEIDLIILDLIMPDMMGSETFDRLK
ncbi:MAG: PAS domain S-box protein, partial [Desulfatirhabdiaceae bacterium]